MMHVRMIEGPVEHGNALGRTIGFPTANIRSEESTLPSDGIYASLTRVQGGRLRDSVSYVGRRPVVDGVERLLEVFLFDFSGDLYGRILTTMLIAKVRNDRSFDGLTSLKRQIVEDCAHALRILAQYRSEDRRLNIEASSSFPMEDFHTKFHKPSGISLVR